MRIWPTQSDTVTVGSAVVASRTARNEFWCHHPAVLSNEFMYVFRITQLTEHCVFCVFGGTCVGLLYSSYTIYI